MKYSVFPKMARYFYLSIKIRNKGLPIVEFDEFIQMLEKGRGNDPSRIKLY
jgi:hypothetical protein